MLTVLLSKEDISLFSNSFLLQLSGQDKEYHCLCDTDRLFQPSGENVLVRHLQAHFLPSVGIISFYLTTGDRSVVLNLIGGTEPCMLHWCIH